MTHDVHYRNNKIPSLKSGPVTVEIAKGETMVIKSEPSDRVIKAQEFFTKVAKIASTLKVLNFIYPLSGYIILNLDVNKPVVSREKQGGGLGLLMGTDDPYTWLRVWTIDGSRYDFIYVQGFVDCIGVIRKRMGCLESESFIRRIISDSTTNEELSVIFENWPKAFGASPKEDLQVLAGKNGERL